MQNRIRTGFHGFFTGLSILLISACAVADGNKHKNHMAANKVEQGLSIMILGSGSPVAAPDRRASAGYMIFIDKQPEVLMDAGGGVYQRIADSGMNIADLDTILISHLHIDHMGDIPPIIKALYFHNLMQGKTRTAPINFYGPDAAPAGAPLPARDFDSATDFFDGHFHDGNGLNRYLHRFAPAIGAGTFAYTVVDVSYDNKLPMQSIISKDNGLVIKAIGVPHGPVPSLAFRIEYAGKSIVYSGDTTSRSTNGNMIALAQNADLLIYDTAILDDAVPPFSSLHTTPTRIGEVAAAAGVKKLVLSHLTPTTADNIKDIKRSVRMAGYRGPIRVAHDLRVYNLHNN